MLITSSAPTAAYASSRPISAVSSATSSGASSGIKICGKRSYGRCSWPGACWNRSAAPEVECIGKGKAHRPYEFGVKVSIATTVKHSAGGQFVTHATALPGNPYDGHTLGTVIPQMQALIGNILDRCITDAGYRGHNAPPDHKFKVYTSAQKRPSRRRSSASSNGVPPLSPSSAISSNITAWTAITLPTQAATPSTPCSPPSAIISAASSRG